MRPSCPSFDPVLAPRLLCYCYQPLRTECLDLVMASLLSCMYCSCHNSSTSIRQYETSRLIPRDSLYTRYRLCSSCMLPALVSATLPHPSTARDPSYPGATLGKLDRRSVPSATILRSTYDVANVHNQECDTVCDSCGYPRDTLDNWSARHFLYMYAHFAIVPANTCCT